MHRLALAAAVAFGSAISAAPGQAQGICLCPLCPLGLETSYRQTSEAMVPTLRPGDCIRARRLKGQVRSGEIVVFRGPQDVPQVFRVIATEGQRIEVRDGVPVIDGQIADRVERSLVGPDTKFDGPIPCADGGYGCQRARARETLPGGTSYDVFDFGPDGYLDNLAEAVVPRDRVFLMGDNRDNAMDSRVSHDEMGPGMVPVNRILGVVPQSDDR